MWQTILPMILNMVGNKGGSSGGSGSSTGNPLGYGGVQSTVGNVLGGRNPGAQITGQGEESQGSNNSGLMGMILGMLGNKGGAIQGGRGGTNTGMQTQNILGQNRNFGTWSPYR
jgi:hypothetical protein